MKKLLYLFILLAALPAACQLSKIGSCQAASTSCTPPSHQIGDLFIAYAGRDAGTTAPTLPSGWTSVGTSNINGTGSADSGVRIACKVATSTSETVTGFTNATSLIAVVWRGEGSGTTATCASAILGTPSFFDSTADTTTTTETFNAITSSDSSSWIAGFGYAPAATAGIGTAPTGMTNTTSSGTIMGAHDTNATAASFTSANVTLTTAGRIITVTLEIKAAQVATPTFDQNGGPFGDSATATISDATASATICVTSDDSTPTASAGTCTNGTTYSGGISITQRGVVLQAIASKSGMVNSAVAKSASFAINVNNGFGMLGAGASKILPVRLAHATACNNGTGGTSIACVPPSTTQGSFIWYAEEDADNPSAPSVPTGEATAVQDGTFAAAANGRTTYFHTSVANGGIASVTGHPFSSTHSAMQIREYTGPQFSSSPLDAISSAYASNTSSTAPMASTIGASQSDLAIATCGEGSSNNAHYVAGADWGNLKDFPQPNDTTDTAAVDSFNVPQSQFTGAFTADSRNHNCVGALYKMPTPGQTPSGNRVSLYTDFENSTDGTTITAAIMAAATHGGAGTWSMSGSPTISTSGEMALVLNQTVNGITYAAPDSGTRGLRYDPGAGGGYAQFTLLNPVSTLSAGIKWKSPATVPDTTTHTFLEIQGAGAADFAAVAMPIGASYLVCETQGGDSTIHIPITASTVYRLSLQYVAGGLHSCAAFDGSGNQVGSTATHAATGSNNATAIMVGNTHAGAGISGNYSYLDGLIADQITAVFPLLD